MASQDIDFYLARLNRTFTEKAAHYFAYIHPVVAVLSLVCCIVVMKILRKQTGNVPLKRLLSCIVLLESFSLVVRAPLFSWFLSTESLFTDYLEYRYCEIFQRINNDTPQIMSNASSFVKAGLALHAIILVFKPEKEATWLSSAKTILYCMFACLVAVLSHIPLLYMTDFMPVKWVSKLNPTIERECCIVLPHKDVLYIEYYQRNAFVGTSVTCIGIPYLLILIISVVLAIHLCRTRNASFEDKDSKRRENVACVLWCFLAFLIFKLPTFVWSILVSLIYGTVDLGVPLPKLVYDLTHIVIVESICTALVAPSVLLVYSLKQRDFRNKLRDLFRRESKLTADN